MTCYKKFLLLIFSLFPFYSFGQAIDPSILSQLSPEQIEAAKDAYAINNSIDNSKEELPVIDESLVNKKPIEDANRIAGKKYGYEFFSSMPTSLAAAGDLPLPNDYIISLKDQFSIILSGSKDARFNLDVKLDGTIFFPELGSVSVVGLTFKDVKTKLSQLIAQAYIGVNIDVSLQNLSAKKVTIVGAVNTPGTYLVNPFSTITGALAYSGGISEIGSLRDIKLIRNNKEVFSFDLYDLLIKGDRSNDITIEAGDTLLINAAMQFVEITGAVRRPGIYEVLEGETINSLVDFALGFTQTANKSNISVSFLDLSEASIVKKNIDTLDQNLLNALSVNVFNYVNEPNANILVQGAIEEPGFYNTQEYKKLSDLINDLKFINVYPWLGVLEQFDENELIKSIVLFNLNDPKTYNSVQLLPNSKIYFANINDRTFDVTEASRDLITEYELTISHKQRSFRLPVYGKFSVNSFINLLGLDMSDVDSKATYVSPLKNIVVNENYKNMQFTAEKYHTVNFKSPVNNLIEVSISGAVSFPGTYILNDDASLEDLYQLVGDFKDQASLSGIILTRNTIRENQLEAIQKSREELNEAILVSSQSGKNIVDLNAIRELSENIEPKNLGRLAGDFSPKTRGSMNTILFDGDAIIVPKKTNTISVLGEVLNPITFEYNKKLTVSLAINQSGGFTQSADKKRVYLIKSNGIIQKTNRNIFGRNVSLEPGDTIIVPRKIITNNSGIEALIPVTQFLSNLAFSAAALDNLSSNN